MLYAGIVAENACAENKNRFLVFFDDGFAQYLPVKKLHHVYHTGKVNQPTDWPTNQPADRPTKQPTNWLTFLLPPNYTNLHVDCSTQSLFPDAGNVYWPLPTCMPAWDSEVPKMVLWKTEELSLFCCWCSWKKGSNIVCRPFTVSFDCQARRFGMK